MEEEKVYIGKKIIIIFYIILLNLLIHYIIKILVIWEVNKKIICAKELKPNNKQIMQWKYNDFKIL